MDTNYQLVKGDINSTISFTLNNGRVIFKKYALIDDEFNILITFLNKNQADRLKSNKLYENSTLIELALPEDIIVACIKTRIFDNPNEVIAFINGGYKDCAEYKVTHIERELDSDTMNTDILTLDEYKTYKQNVNKKALADYLENNPLLWSDGKYYGVSQEDQIEMQTDLTVYNLKQANGQTDWKLEWHDKTKACREFGLEEFYSLMSAIVDFVYPLRRKQEGYKEQIYACETREELDAIVISYND